VDQSKLNSFIDAFDSHGGSCHRNCECGRQFFDDYNGGYTWNDGELEALQANPEVTALQHSVGSILLEGREYVMDCDCWHARAERVIGWLDNHASEIAEYLSLEKKRKQKLADESPVVE
jgi:hypothetical protein